VLFDGPGMVARDALVPRVAREDDVPLVRATSLQETLQNTAQFVGPLAAGLLIAAVADEFSEATGAAENPVDSRVTRWGGALPQYAVGHNQRVSRVLTAVDAAPGLAVCGAAYDGVGIPACIAGGESAALRILRHLRDARQPHLGDARE